MTVIGPKVLTVTTNGMKCVDHHTYVTEHIIRLYAALSFIARLANEDLKLSLHALLEMVRPLPSKKLVNVSSAFVKSFSKVHQFLDKVRHNRQNFCAPLCMPECAPPPNPGDTSEAQ
jgi:hypothetical protein